MQSINYLNSFYDSYDEDSRLLSRYGAVEYLTTMRYIEKYLTPGARIIEIGAGTGRYSHALARMGYAVDAVELVEHNIDVFRQNIRPEERVTIAQGNALDISAFASNRYDLTLLLGPMYHLYSRTDQLQALSEAIRVTKPGGIVFAAYCMADASLINYSFIGGHMLELMEKQMVDPITFEAFSKPSDIFELYRKEKIDALRSAFDVTQLHFVASDGHANYMRQTLIDMDEATYQLFLKYHFATCERAELVGMSHHTLDIFRKNR